MLSMILTSQRVLSAESPTLPMVSRHRHSSRLELIALDVQVSVTTRRDLGRHTKRFIKESRGLGSHNIPSPFNTMDRRTVMLHWGNARLHCVLPSIGPICSTSMANVKRARQEAPENGGEGSNLIILLETDWCLHFSNLKMQRKIKVYSSLFSTIALFALLCFTMLSCTPIFPKKFWSLQLELEV